MELNTSIKIERTKVTVVGFRGIDRVTKVIKVSGLASITRSQP